MQLLSCKSDARCCLRPRSTAVKSAGKAVGNLHPQYIPLLNLGCIADSGQGVKSGTCPLPHDAAIAGSKRENHRKHTHVAFFESLLKFEFLWELGLRRRVLPVVPELRSGLDNEAGRRLCFGYRAED
jgi:hypothetical protein